MILPLPQTRKGGSQIWGLTATPPSAPKFFMPLIWHQFCNVKVASKFGLGLGT